MTPDSLVTFERASLAEALRTLAPLELQVLVALALGACPRTRRVWTTPLRLADELAATPTPGATHPAPAAIDAILALLIARGHLALYARSHGALASYEVNVLLRRHRDEPPANLPVDPVP